MSEPLCVSCGTNTNFKIVDYENKWKHYLFDNLSIRVCEFCGLGSAFPEPEDFKLETYYLTEYRSLNSPMFIDFDLINMFDIGLKAQSQAAYILKHISVKSRKKDTYRGLDLGAGAGELLRQVSQNIPIKYSVVEKSSDAIEFYKKNGIEVYDDLFSLPHKFDLIQSSHVLEHISSSQIFGYLKALNEKLSDNGYMFIEVPNDDFRKGKFCITADCQSSHLTFFSVDSLTELLAKSGFKILDISTSGNVRKKVSLDSSVSKAPIIFTSSLKRKIGHIIKVAANRLGLLRIYHKTKHFLSKPVIANSSEFKYGDNRDVIRVICIKSC